MSVKTKVTLWFSIILVIIVSLTFVSIISVSGSVLEKNSKNDLIKIVEKNVDEIEYYYVLHYDKQDKYDVYISYNDGYLQIDDDFLDNVRGINTALYDENSNLIYGENLLGEELSNLNFSDSVIQTLTISGVKYYVFDRKLEGEDLNGLWLRGVISEAENETKLSDISRISLISLVIILIIGIFIGVFIAGKVLSPIKKITDAAVRISNGNNLKERINLGEGKDEIKTLAKQFDDMMDKLEKNFEKEKRFTSDASHELRTPVSVISAQCEYILESPKDSTEYVEAFEVISRQSKKMTNLINDMLYFSRFENKKGDYVMRKIDFSKCVSSLCEDLSLIKDKNITLSYSVDEGIEISGEKELLERLITNLISNSYKYGKENGEIKVSLKKEQSKTVLSVWDNGIGISEDDMGKIFERFYCSDKSRSGSGTGLGLAIAKEIAIFHGGDLFVESSPKEGTTFKFII